MKPTVDPLEDHTYPAAVFRLSRKTEYGLLALSYLRGHMDHGVCSAKDISEYYQIPPSLLAKVMQRLKRAGLVTSVQGTSGGYALEPSFGDTSFLEFMGCFEEDVALVDCLIQEDSPACQQAHCCSIRNPIAALNDAIQAQFQSLTLEDLVQPASSTGTLVSLHSLSR